jgi:hypothetical protein
MTRRPKQARCACEMVLAANLLFVRSTLITISCPQRSLANHRLLVVDQVAPAAKSLKLDC